MTPRPRAFTLLETLVAIAISAVLLSAAIYAYRLAIPRARSAVCLTHLRELGIALELYLGEHNDTMPVLAAARTDRGDDSHATLDTVLRPYLDAPEVLCCPEDDAGLCQETGTSYFWNSTLNGQKSSNLRFLLTRDSALIPVITDKEAFHKGVGTGVNILYADGRVEKEFQFQTGR